MDRQLFMVILTSLSLSSASSSPASPYLSLLRKIQFTNLEEINGATYHNDRLLIYTSNTLLIVNLEDLTRRPELKYIINFQCLKLAAGYKNDEAYFLSPGQHCVRKLDLETRQTSTFSGDCDESGFTDGPALNARYNGPSDIHMTKSGFLYIADTYNDCIRLIDREGRVDTILSIHRQPFAIGGELFVAAGKKIYDVVSGMHTYTTFIRDVNVTTLESCTPDSLAILTPELCCQLLPLSRDLSYNPALIEGPFSSLSCQENSTVLTKMTVHIMNSSLTLEIYKIDTERAMSHRDTVIETTIASPSKHKTEVDTTTSIQTDPVTSATHTTKLDTTVSIPAYTTTKPTTRMNLPRTKPPPVIVHSSVRASKDSSITPGTTTVNGTVPTTEHKVPKPLHNHAHDTFAHLPRGYSATNKSMEVVVATVLAGITLVLIMLALICVVKKRKRRLNPRELAALDGCEMEQPRLQGQTITLLPDPRTNENGYKNGHLNGFT